MFTRAVAPAVGVALLTLVAVTLAGVVAAGIGVVGTPEPPPRAAFDLSVDADTNRVVLTHLGGDTLDVRELRFRVSVDGTPLVHQPPVPFFSARGFLPGPVGPFNSAASPRWTTGETASFRLASTNAPAIAAGATVRIEVYAAGHLIVRSTVTA